MSILKIRMEIWAIIFYIFAFLILAVPLTLSFIFFKKCPKGSCAKGSLVFTNIYLAPGYINGSTVALITDLSTFMIVLWIIGGLSGIGIAILNFVLTKRNAKITHDDYAFNHTSGLIGCYGLLYFFAICILIHLIEDEDDKSDKESSIFGYFEFKYRQRAWIYFLVEIVHFSGFFLSTMGIYYILKHDLPKCFLVILMVTQSVSYAFNISYLFDFQMAYIIIIVVLGIINIIIGCYLWIKYKSDAEPFNDQTGCLDEKTNELVVTTYGQNS